MPIKGDPGLSCFKPWEGRESGKQIQEPQFGMKIPFNRSHVSNSAWAQGREILIQRELHGGDST